MKTIRTTTEYDAWFNDLQDMRAQNRIDVRLHRLALGATSGRPRGLAEEY